MKNLRKIIVGSLSISLIVLLIVSLNIINVYGVTYTDDLIPTMTSNTAPLGIASASSEYSTFYHAAFQAFNDVDNEYGWGAANGTTTGWLAYEFPSNKIIRKYTLMSRKNSVTYATESPKNWTFEGYDGTNWVVLDTRTNITNWQMSVKKEFEFSNNTSYKKYRINVTANNGHASYLAIGEMEMMEEIITIPDAPTNLSAKAADSQITLEWDAVDGAASYNIKRATASGAEVTIATDVYDTSYTDTGLTNGTTYYYVVSAVNSEGESGNSDEVNATPVGTPTLTASAGDTQVTLTWNAVAGATGYNVKRAGAAGGSYTTIQSNFSGTSYTDTGLTNGTTYYYVVSAVNTGGESPNSNEVPATPQKPDGNRAILVVTMVNGSEKEYDLTKAEVDAFINWYDNKTNGTGKAYYTISKNYNLGPFSNRKDNIVFDKIMNFEVMEYNQ